MIRNKEISHYSWCHNLCKCCFLILYVSLISVRPLGPRNLKYLLSGPSPKTFADPCFRALLSVSVHFIKIWPRLSCIYCAVWDTSQRHAPSPKFISVYFTIIMFITACWYVLHVFVLVVLAFSTIVCLLVVMSHPLLWHGLSATNRIPGYQSIALLSGTFY